MTGKEKLLVPQIILNDLKYLSIRQLYLNWFFTTGAEVANQLLDNVIKAYLQSIERRDLIKVIRKWGGNEAHNVVRMIELLIKEISLDFDLGAHKSVLDNLYKIYQLRYLDSLQEAYTVNTSIKDLDSIDYAYEYFRDKINISEQARAETIINKLFLSNQDMRWGEDKISLYGLFSRNNHRFVHPPHVPNQ